MSVLMTPIPFTPEQREAIETCDRSVIVTAAAGSGKTAVLAERCAYLICDAPEEARCSVDGLLVLTFTEAAAAQMRSKIVEALRSRLEVEPTNDRLVEQLALIDAARISTIHSFCLWLVRRWFNHAGVDPAATVMDADEAELLRRDVLESLFSKLYDATNTSEEPLGRTGCEEAPQEAQADEASDTTDPTPTPCEGSLGRDFAALVGVYGLGDDTAIAKIVLNLAGFLASLPNPQSWLDDARLTPSERPESVVAAGLCELIAELQRQIAHCEQTAARLEDADPACQFHAGKIRDYATQLREWLALAQIGTSIQDGDQSEGGGTLDVGKELAVLDAMQQAIAAFEFDKKQGPRLSKDTDPSIRAARDRARDEFADVKKRLFGNRLERRFGLFPVDELIDGLRRTAPFVATLVELTSTFRRDYARKKRELGVLDFSDLERSAFELLAEPGTGMPSDIARTLQHRFAHVLVDEFQDINPIQSSIIRMASREPDPDRANNLFAVGDVKQSIYRFRLAEPTIFTSRLDRFHDAASTDKAIPLQRNFRSRPAILEAVNALFSRLMRRGTGEVVYDDHAELRPGRRIDASGPHHPVEVHVLERMWDVGDGDDEEAQTTVADLTSPERLAPIEREALLVASRIRDWMTSGNLTIEDRPLAYSDIAVLLRASRVNADRMATVLGAMGIPAYAEVGGSLFGALEIRDVIAVLQVLDNFQQDIPLAAVLHGGVLGDPLSEIDLVEIRCLDRDTEFHAATREYAKCGRDSDLASRLKTLLATITRLRDRARHRPPADLLWTLYKQHGYLARAGGSPNGEQRRANLLKLHELARRFGTFRRQGLHRFLRFIESLEDEKQTIAVAPTTGETENVVRIMSIHQSKGLEFPVVFVAGLGTRFNLGDRSGRMIFERNAKIGLRVVDTERMIEYPTVAHRRVAAEIERTTREEELRILYVAMTRARDKLVLTGSVRGIGRFRDHQSNAQADGSKNHESGQTPPSLLSIVTAEKPLDWLLPVLATLSPAALGGCPGKPQDRPIFDLHLHDEADMIRWHRPPRLDDRDQTVKEAVARCERLPESEPLKPDDPMVESVISRVDFVYPHLPSVSVRASIGASDFKGPFDFTRNPEQRPETVQREGSVEFTPRHGAPDHLAAVRRGLITHRVLQHLDFSAATGAGGVASELHRMEAEGVIEADDAEFVDSSALEWFVSTPLAESIRAAGDQYRREFPYVATEPVTVFDRSVGDAPGDHVLVRGIVDGILPAANEIDIVDFKTDSIAPEAVAQRAERYRPQMELYARAMSRLWRKPVRHRYLVFLSARTCFCLPAASGD